MMNQSMFSNHPHGPRRLRNKTKAERNGPRKRRRKKKKKTAVVRNDDDTGNNPSDVIEERKNNNNNNNINTNKSNVIKQSPIPKRKAYWSPLLRKCVTVVQNASNLPPKKALS